MVLKTDPFPAANVNRRDFLANGGLALLGIPFVARAAFAQNPSPTPVTDTNIARLAIYPALGISRVGNSLEWFLAPEIPGLPPLTDGRYKDAALNVKKQVQRFRVYAFNKAGQVIREVTAPEARIVWTVHVANTKAAWYGFNNPLDNGDLAPGLPSQKRNPGIVDNAERAAMLVIDAGARAIAGTNINGNGGDPAFSMIGRFWRTMDVKLGHLQTDGSGRLLVFPGDGVSRSSVPNNPIRNFSDNDAWHDDWCDGVVQAEVTLANGTAMTADNAWIASVGPNFAPDIVPFTTLYDVMSEVNVDAGWGQRVARPLSFRKHIYPLFHRLALLQWVAAAANLSRGWIDTGDFADPGYLAHLADPGNANRAFRQHVFEAFRNPHSGDVQQFKLPYMLGDGINYRDSPLRWFRILETQYGVLQSWADGAFVNDAGPFDQPEQTVRLEQIPLAEQPEALNRAALEACNGGAFHPGVELTWPLRHKELYSGPFRIALAANRTPNLIHDLGNLLTPDRALKGYAGAPPVIAPQMPGDLTRWMGLPWQCDAFSCQQVSFANDFPNATWWPARLPIDVLPERFYEQLMDARLPADQRIKFFENRVPWSRGVAGIGYHAEASYSDGLSQMIYLWSRMGFVVARPGPADDGRPTSIPSVVYVETDRGSMDAGAPR